MSLANALFKIAYPRRRDVTIFNAYHMLNRADYYKHVQAGVPNPNEAGKMMWVPARSLGPSWDQWKAVWLVLTGRADVLHWPGQEQ